MAAGAGLPPNVSQWVPFWGAGALAAACPGEAGLARGPLGCAAAGSAGSFRVMSPNAAQPSAADTGGGAGRDCGDAELGPGAAPVPNASQGASAAAALRAGECWGERDPMSSRLGAGRASAAPLQGSRPHTRSGEGSAAVPSKNPSQPSHAWLPALQAVKKKLCKGPPLSHTLTPPPRWCAPATPPRARSSAWACLSPAPPTAAGSRVSPRRCPGLRPARRRRPPPTLMLLQLRLVPLPRRRRTAW